MYMYIYCGLLSYLMAVFRNDSLATCASLLFESRGNNITNSTMGPNMVGG